MKSIKLRCQTRGFEYGSIILVGKDIPAEDAQSLVEEGLATVAEFNKDIPAEDAPTTKKGK